MSAGRPPADPIGDLARELYACGLVEITGHDGEQATAITARGEPFAFELDAEVAAALLGVPLRSRASAWTAAATAARLGVTKKALATIERRALATLRAALSGPSPRI